MQKPHNNITYILMVVLLMIFLSACQSVPTAAPVKPPVQKPTENPVQSSGDISSSSDASAGGVTNENTPTSAASAGTQVFMIDGERSEVRFLVDEVLRGENVTVIGTTASVSGQISTDYSDLSTTTISPIEVNAGTLVTDESRRNSAIYKFILQTNQYPNIIFTPREIIGLPEKAVVGESYNFQISGDLVIREITQAVVFDVTATPVSETELSGSAMTSIQRSDFNLTIPSVPFVASVDETIQIEIDLVAIVQ